MNEGAQGLGNYLMEAAQTMGDTLTKIFDRIGELTVGAASALTGAFGGQSTTTTVATAAAAGASSAASAVSAPAVNSPSAPEIGAAVGAAVGQAATAVITLPAAAFAALKAEKDNPISMEWSSPDLGVVLCNLPSPNTPTMGVDRSAGMAMA
jgi:hypothetical protein